MRRGLVTALFILLLIIFLNRSTTGQHQHQQLRRLMRNNNNNNLVATIIQNKVDETYDATTINESSLSRVKIEGTTDSRNSYDDTIIYDDNHTTITSKKLQQVKDFIHTMVQENMLSSHATTTTNNNSNNLTAIIHVGPMKTGSTAIQITLPKMRYELTKTNFVFGNRLMPLSPWFAMCFDLDSLLNVQVEMTDDCQISALDDIRQIAIQEKQNLIFSTERFSNPSIDTYMLKEYLHAAGWDNIMIVMFYRRYYDWLLSVHNQANKKKSIEDRVSFLPTLVREKNNPTSTNDPWHKKYVVREYQRFVQSFGSTNVQIYNMHTISDGDVRTELFCNALHPYDTNGLFCSKLHEIQQEEINRLGNDRINSHHSFIYEELAYYALQMKLWQESKSLTLTHVIELVKYHQEQVLQLTEYDFGNNYHDNDTDSSDDNIQKCPPDDVMEWFLQVSLIAEEILFPEYYKKQGQQEMIQDFALSKSKFCTYDAKAILIHSQEWRKFFTNL